MHITNRAPPTAEVAAELQLGSNHFNDKLFEGRLPACVLTLARRSRRTYGYFRGDGFARDCGGIADEIALNPIHVRARPVLETLSTLVHEQVHQWQHHFGRMKSRRGYHNREWAGEMLRLGLHPSNTGAPGGRMTGQQMTHYVLAGGRFETAARELLATGFALSWGDNRPPPTLPTAAEPMARTSSGKRLAFTCPGCLAFTCPGCGDAAWGKSSLQLICGKCERPMHA